MDMQPKFAAIATAVHDRLQIVFQKVFHQENPDIFFPTPRLEISDEVTALTLRGGKRIRAALMAAGYELFSGNPLQNAALVDAACAMELLQTYFLIHDDIMDGDTLRRGGTSVHVSLQQKTGDKDLGVHLGILAGDLACAAQEWLLARLECPEDLRTRVQRIFSRMHMDVIFGQAMDLQRSAPPLEIVQRKTASYTTIGPLCIGAILGGATEAQLIQIAAIAKPMGIAFQYRDDFIGVFGQAREVGKPVGSDLKNNKRTSLIEDAMSHLSSDDRQALRHILQSEVHSDAGIASALLLIEKSGAKERCESTIQSLYNDVSSQLAALPFRTEGKFFLLWLCKLLAHRTT